jgi:cell division transport system permease protein
MRLGFMMSETGIGLRRNVTMTLAGVLTVAIAILLVGTGWYLREQVNRMKDYWYGKIDVQVFLQNSATAQDMDAINSTLHSLPGVTWVHFVDHQQAWQVFKYDFRSDPALVKDTDPSALPESFVVKLADPRNYGIVQSAVGNLPGVEQVATESSALHQLFSFMNGLKTTAWIIAVIAAIVATLLVFNTTRIAAFNRRRELGIMRLVGASNAYVQLPFVLEGVTVGLAGGLVGIFGLTMVKYVVVDHVIAPNLHFINVISWGVVLAAFPWFVVGGILLSALASGLTVQRYVQV